jgi:hypothetical protein
MFLIYESALKAADAAVLPIRWTCAVNPTPRTRFLKIREYDWCAILKVIFTFAGQRLIFRTSLPVGVLYSRTRTQKRFAGAEPVSVFEKKSDYPVKNVLFDGKALYNRLKYPEKARFFCIAGSE